jgi:hypothetical protein
VQYSTTPNHRTAYRKHHEEKCRGWWSVREQSERRPAQHAGQRNHHAPRGSHAAENAGSIATRR